MGAVFFPFCFAYAESLTIANISEPFKEGDQVFQDVVF